MVELLIANGADPNVRKEGSRRSPALNVAAAAGSLDVVKALIDKGADVNLESSTGSSALASLTTTGSPNLEIAQLLIASGANVNATFFNGWTALHAAAERGNAAFVELLLSAGADPDMISSDAAKPGTPLDWAVKANQSEVADLLQQHGAGQQGSAN